MKRHDLDVFSLVSGLLFAGLGVIFALNAIGTFEFDVRVVPATVLIVLGIAGISASFVKASRSARSGRAVDPVTQAAPDPTLVTTDGAPDD